WGLARGADSARAASGVAAAAAHYSCWSSSGPCPRAPFPGLDLGPTRTVAGEGQQDERGNSTQRGEPQHAGDEQPRHLALVRAGHWASPRRAAQHPLRERPRRLDPHQPHPQHVKGTPFETPDQGKARLLTHWEQMDYGVQFTASRKFLTITPIVLYFLTSFYTKYDQIHFILNTVSLMSVLIPKLPQLHGVRIFGINKY
uniref:Uncharacterized protein n=1 Tax=Ovis aries TaxID=9940 RepID=A0AC11CW75_SHEEP